MSITIQPVDLASHRHTIINTLSQYLTDQSIEERYDWLYKKSPHGQAKVWLAIHGASKIVGAAAAFPRIFDSGDRKFSAWVLGDFCLAPQYRSLGPALQLQRACLRPVGEDGNGFCYDFPSASMVAVYKRLGFSMTGEMVRLAKPLRVDRKVNEWITIPAAQRVASSVGNAVLSIGLRKRTADRAIEISIQSGPCAQEFTVLAQEHCRKFQVCVQRSAEYLNWRYLENPLAHHEIITARKSGRLAGYIVWSQVENDASIVDLFGERDAAMVRYLVCEIVSRAHKAGAVTLSVSINESHPWHALFSELGFRVRDSSPVVIIPSKAFSQKIDPQLGGWYLMQGDRDS